MSVEHDNSISPIASSKTRPSYSQVMEEGCQVLSAAAQDAGLPYVEPHGGYFMMLDTTPLGLEFDTSEVTSSAVSSLLRPCSPVT